MYRAIKLFIGTFFVVLIVNQMFYGFCFTSYCLSHAFPKVVVLSAIITAVIHFVSKPDSSAQS